MASKIYGEEMVKAYCDCYGIKYIIIRPSTVYGPHIDFTSRLFNNCLMFSDDGQGAFALSILPSLLIKIYVGKDNIR